MGTRKSNSRGLNKTRKVFVPRPTEKIKPGNDFYMYINKKWLSGANIPPSDSSFGVGEEVENQIRERLLGHIKNIIKQPINNLPQHEQIVATFFKSGLYSNRHKDHERTFKGILSGYSCMKTAEDVMSAMGKLVRCGVPTHLSITLGRNLNNPSQTVPAISTGSLSLPDISYYEGTGPGGSNALESFQTFLESVGKHYDYKDMGRVANLESAAAEHYHMGSREDPQMTTGKGLATKYKHIPWNSFWTAYGLKDTEWKKLHIMNNCHSWLMWLNSQLKTLIVSDWANWFRVQNLVYLGPYIPSPIDTLHFEFFDKKLRGDTVKMSQEHLLFNSISSCLQPILSIMYKKCCISDSHQKSIRHFVNKIIVSAYNRINKLDWMSEKTKSLTKEKIRKLRLEVIDSNIGKNYKISVKVMSQLDIIHNILICSEALTVRDIYYIRHPGLVTPPIDEIFEVNAHYYMYTNKLVIPGGITLWPFYDSSKNPISGWSLGGLGSIVGHEILHAFDNEGKDFDPNGYFKPWWTNKDMEAYNKKINAIIKLFGNTKYMGRFVNGKTTLSENIADLGGLSISLETLKQHLDKNNISGEKRKKELRDFFISYAVSWRTKEKKQRSIYRLFTDVHAPAPLRVNLIVSQFQDFYDVFNVQPKDSLYVDPKNRITIF